MFCPNCGTENEDSARFCLDCGAQLSSGNSQGDAQAKSTASSTASQSPAGNAAGTASNAAKASDAAPHTAPVAQTASGSSKDGFLGPYQLLGELGRGAMARVWRAFDPNLEREVA
ncbi:MAG: zinc-ribbon domain-containing protein, partial [Eggerthellaceae bacterium]|nr:zinc-ribbon domain-containing protein [Eggerthellaceae bacterium]